jgi:hypothetical protein
VNVPDLLLRVECYVGLRNAIGYTVRCEEKLLKDFIQFVASQNSSGPIRAQMAIDWACVHQRPGGDWEVRPAALK